ncbi:MAG: Flagellar biosynthesis protein FliO [Planctomycetota bacterium]|jgi:flagellar biosynthetic protein FliO
MPASVRHLLRSATLIGLLLSGLAASEAPVAATAPFFSDAEWQSAPTVPATPGAAAPTLATVVVSLVAVAGLAVGLGWLAKRTGLRKLIPGSGGHLEVVDRLALGRRRALILVRCGDRLFLVGDSEQGLQGCGEMPMEGVPALSFQRQMRAAQQAPETAP